MTAVTETFAPSAEQMEALARAALAMLEPPEPAPELEAPASAA